MLARITVCVALCTLFAPAILLSAEEAPVAGALQTAKVFEKQITVTVRYEYLLSLPADYQKQEKWPLVLFLHGSGECGSDIQKVKANGPPKFADEKPYPFILVSPQAPEDRWDIPSLNALVDGLLKELKVDPDRVYVTGLSLGGGATWHLIASAPEKFAAAAPVCGWNPKAKTAEKIKNIPLWVFHGDKDKAVPLSHSQRMVDALKPLNAAEVKFTVYPGVGHDCWNQAYAEPELWNWLLAQKRK
jgi:predicted peptidase